MKNFSRRSFLQNIGLGAGASAVALAMPSFLPLPENNNRYQGKKLNIALVGLGVYAGYLAEGIAVSEYCNLAGIVTGHPAKATEWKKKYHIADKNIYNYDNFDEIKNNKDIDLVYIVLPNSMHKEFTLRSAKAGKHVITEKPMAINAADCEEMIKACKDANVQLAVGYRLHYEPYNMEIKRLGQEKVFGPVKLIEVSLGYKSADPSEWRLQKALAGGGPLMNIGIYCVQAARYVTGEEPISVTAQFGPVTSKDIFKEVEESVSWQLQFPGGTLANSVTSYNCSVDRFFASADNGFFELSPAISYGPFKGRTSKGELKFPVINQQAKQVDEIGKLILANQPLPLHIAGEEGLKDMKVIDAIYKSASTGQKILLG